MMQSSSDRISSLNQGALSTYRSTDAMEHAQALRDWNLEILQISGGRFHGSLTQIQLDNIQIVLDGSDKALIKRGTCWPGSMVFSLPIAASGCGFSGGRSLPYEAGLLSDGQDLPEIVTPTNLDVIYMTFHRNWFAAKAEEFGCPSLSSSRSPHLRLAIPLEWHGALGRFFLTIFREVTNRPALLDFSESRREIENSIMQNLLGVFFRSREIEPQDDTARKKTADRARAFVLNNLYEAPNISVVCDHIGVSRRHLQNCFMHTYGHSATYLLRTIRLNGVRTDLRRCLISQKSESIGDIAAKWGFWHWSRFAGDYRQLFGELPSQTYRGHA